MNRSSLRVLLENENIDPRSYSISGQASDDTYVLEVAAGGWAVYFSERGNRVGQHLYSTEDEACRALFDELLRDSTTRSGEKRGRGTLG